MTPADGVAANTAPVAAAERIRAVDTIRGVALLGILLMNILSFALPSAAEGDPTQWDGATRWNLASWFLNQVLFEGKMRALFSMLFGAGVILFTARGEARGAETADLYLRRTLWLAVFGLAHSYLLWAGDILFYYGITGLFLYTFRNLPPARLVLCGALTLGVLVPVNIGWAIREQRLEQEALAAMRVQASGAALSSAQEEAIDDWRTAWNEAKRPRSKVEAEVQTYRKGYLDLLAERAKGVLRIHTEEFYQDGLFDAAGMMFFGMALFKSGVLSAKRSRKFYWKLLAAGYGIGIPANAAMGLWTMRSGFHPVPVHWDSVWYDAGRLTVALGHIGAVMLVLQSGWFRPLTDRLAAAGQMALTNYLSDTILCTTLFNGYGFGLFGKLERYQLLGIVVAIWILQLIWSPLWLSRYRFGPAEWLWRSLTYWKLQPMRLQRTST